MKFKLITLTLLALIGASACGMITEEQERREKCAQAAEARTQQSLLSTLSTALPMAAQPTAPSSANPEVTVQNPYLLMTAEKRGITPNSSFIELLCALPYDLQHKILSYFPNKEQALDFWTSKTRKKRPNVLPEIKAVSKDGTQHIKRTAGWDWSYLEIWDAKEKKCLHRLTRYDGRFETAAFSPDGTQVVTAAALKKGHMGASQAEVWNAATGQHIRTLTTPEGGVKSVCFSPDGTKLMLKGTIVQIYDAHTGNLLSLYEGSYEGQARFSYDSKKLFTVTRSNNSNAVTIWDLATKKQVLTIENVWSSPVCFSPDSKNVHVFTTAQNTATWDIATGNRIQMSGSLGGCKKGIYDAFYSPDCTKVLAITERYCNRKYEYTLNLCDAQKGTCLRKITVPKKVYSPYISPDGKKIYTWSLYEDPQEYDLSLVKNTTLKQKLFLLHAYHCKDEKSLDLKNPSLKAIHESLHPELQEIVKQECTSIMDLCIVS